VKQEGHFAFGMILALGARSPAFNWNRWWNKRVWRYFAIPDFENS